VEEVIDVLHGHLEVLQPQLVWKDSLFVEPAEVNDVSFHCVLARLGLELISARRVQNQQVAAGKRV
jgi:hypothetical protein